MMKYSFVYFLLYGVVINTIPWDNVPSNTKQLIVVNILEIEDVSAMLNLGIEEIELLFVSTSSLTKVLNSGNY